MVLSVASTDSFVLGTSSLRVHNLRVHKMRTLKRSLPGAPFPVNFCERRCLPVQIMIQLISSSVHLIQLLCCGTACAGDISRSLGVFELSQVILGINLPRGACCSCMLQHGDYLS